MSRKRGVVELHALLEARHLRHLLGLAAGAARRDHRRVAVLLVHLQLRLVVGAPEPEGDEPGVQQARVVRVLDVLLHQLPVARDALAVVAEDLQLAAVEQAVEVAEDRRAEEVLERLDVVVERREHDAAARRDLQLGEAVLGWS